MITRDKLARMIEQTLVKPTASRQEVRAFLESARKHRFYAVVVNPTWVEVAVQEMAGTGIRTGTAIGFPLGATLTEVKAYEAARAVERGAREIDVVINIGALKGGEADLVREDMVAVVKAVRGVTGVDPRSVTVKAIIETCYLDEREKVLAAQLAAEAGCDFVKTCTGFGPRGVTVDDVVIIKRVLAGKAGIKASGGIDNLEFALRLIEAGATRLGTSKGVELIEEMELKRTQVAKSAGCH